MVEMMVAVRDEMMVVSLAVQKAEPMGLTVEKKVEKMAVKKVAEMVAWKVEMKAEKTAVHLEA